MNTRWLYRGVKVAAIVTVAVAVFGFVVKGLWNGLMPNIFGWHTITFWQAVGLLLLSKILFGGFRGRGGHGWHGRGRWRGEMWRQKWDSMTPEERERLRARFKHRCGWSPEEPPGEQTKP